MPGGCMARMIFIWAIDSKNDDLSTKSTKDTKDTKDKTFLVPTWRSSLYTSLSKSVISV